MGTEPPSRPRWVKVFIVVAVALVALFVILQLIGSGKHGPGRHMGFRVEVTRLG